MGLVARDAGGGVMRQVWKFPLLLAAEQLVRMPQGAKLLSAQTQNGQIQLWALVDPTYTERVNRMIAIRGTGHDVEMALSVDKFIGTVQTSGGALVWHLFDGGERD